MRPLTRTLAAILTVILFSAMGMAAEHVEPRVKIDIAGHPFTGLAHAPITLVVFSDYL